MAAPIPAGWLLTWIPLWSALALLAAASRSLWWAWGPCGIAAAGHAWLWVNAIRGPGYSAARRGVVWCLGGVLAALLATVSGAAMVGVFAILFSLATGWVAIRHSLRELPPAPLDLVDRRPGRRSLYFGASLDLSMGALWELGAAFRSKVPLEQVKEEIDRACMRYASLGWNEAPGEVFERPPAIGKAKLFSRRVAGEPVEEMSFDSDFEPFDPEIIDTFRAHKRNGEARAVLWRHLQGPTRPVLISIHGFGMGEPRFDLRWLRVRGWDMPEVHRALDVDIAYYILPLHGARATGRRSGHGFFNQHPLLTNAAMAQAIWDLRRLIQWLRAQGAPRVGVHGISLGGYVASLLASLDDDLAVAMPTIPAVDFAPLIWRQLPGFRRREWRKAGLEPELLERVWGLHSPLRHTPRTDTEGRLIVGAYADRITPPSETLRLWEHWDRCKLHWFPGTHLVWRGGDALPMRWAAQISRHLLHGGGSDAAVDADPPTLSRFRGPR